MARLFVSLYIFITLTLIALSAGLEWIFFDKLAPQNPSTETVVRLFEAAKKQQLDLAQLAKDSALQSKQISSDDIAWPAAKAQKLAQGQAVLLYDAEMGEQLFISFNQSMLLQINLPKQNTQASNFVWYRAVFFVLLGGLLALWIWPLWRDLAALKNSVTNLQPDGSISQNNISKSSLIAPIGDALNSMSRHVQELMQTQRELTGAVAHEFRTPLSRLKFALAVKPTYGSSPWHEMEQDVSELDRLVQEMLDYAGTEAQMPEMNLAEIPIFALCQQLVARLKTSHLSTFNIQIQGDQATILADPHFIERAVENLLLNASRYAQQNLRLLVEKSESFVDLAIEDDGFGVDEALRDKIFEPFFRPDEGRGRAQGGAGLGLAIVKRIMQWHNGECWVTNSSLGGARFVLRFTDHLNYPLNHS